MRYSRPGGAQGGLLVIRTTYLGKANHLPGHFAAKQGCKRFVDVFQRDLTGNHLIEFQLAVQIHLDVARHVDPETVRAHARTLDFFLLQEVRTVQLDLRAYRNHADHRRRAAFGQHRKRLLRGLFEADGLEGVSTPPPVRSLTCCTGSPSEAFTRSVAPQICASSSLLARVSMAMMRPAPAMAAPWTALSPTPPQPITATVLPGGTLAVLITAPTPVVTPQPISAALSRAYPRGSSPRRVHAPAAVRHRRRDWRTDA